MCVCVYHIAENSLMAYIIVCIPTDVKTEVEKAHIEKQMMDHQAVLHVMHLLPCPNKDFPAIRYQSRVWELSFPRAYFIL